METLFVRLNTHFALVVLLLAWAPLQAEWGPAFDLDTCVGKSSVIVQGSLGADGEVTVARVWKGEAGISPKLALDVGKSQYEALQMARPGSIEVVAFLEEKVGGHWRETLQYAGLVGFEQDEVVLMQNQLRTSQYVKSPTDTKAAFLHRLEDALQASQTRDAVLATPRSVGRTRQLVSLALKQTPFIDLEEKPFGCTQNYALQCIATGLATPTEAEQAIILEALRDAGNPHDREVLLTLSGRIPLKDGALESIAAFLPVTNPPEIRIAAMKALSAIDCYRAVDYLCPYLTLEDPQLVTALAALWPSLGPDPVLNLKAVDALEKLTHAVRDRHHREGRHVLGNESYALLAQLAHYSHPRLVPLLYDWAMSGDHVSSNQAFSALAEVIHLYADPDDPTEWKDWWQKAAPLLQGDIDLQTAAGRAQWFERYAQTADPATQRILLRLWCFEPTIDESALLDAASKSEDAKTLLAWLWQGKRLSGKTKKAIVQRFVSVKLVNAPPEAAKTDKTLYGCAVVVSSSFPFPEAAWMENRRTLTIGDRAPAFRSDSWNDWSLQGHGVQDLSWKDSAHAASPPKATALVELRQAGSYPSHTPLWTLTWKLGPIQLSHSP